MKMKGSKSGLKKLKSSKGLRRSVVAVTIIVFGIMISPMIAFAQASETDILCIGDAADNTIERFNAITGEFVDTFVRSERLVGPMGLLFDGNGNLLVASQNVDLTIAGEILQYDGTTGEFLGALVPSTDEYAPWAPRGIILDGSTLYVADLVKAGRAAGRIRSYNATGNFLGDLDIEDLKNTDLHPRGIVFGPDDKLYVSVRDLKKDGLGGHVLRFNQDGSFDKVFIADDGGVGQLNRPEGLVFGSDGKLYITSFRANPDDTDSIRIYSPEGNYTNNKIDLYTVGSDRAYAQAILFGPEGDLFVPIAYPDANTGVVTKGEVRRYTLTLDNPDDPYEYEILIEAGGNLTEPWYLTFGKTDPKYLTYPE